MGNAIKAFQAAWEAGQAAFLSAVKAEDKEEVKLERLKVMDGGDGFEIEAEVFEAGQSVVVVVPDGESQPLPAGEYNLEDGRFLIVAEDGIIDEIKDAEQESEEQEETELSVEQRIEALEAAVSEMKTMLSEAKTSLSTAEAEKAELAKQKEAAEKKAAELETKLSKEPAAKKVVVTDTNKGADVAERPTHVGSPSEGVAALWPN